MAVSHAKFLVAYDALSNLDDVERLSHDPHVGLSFEALMAILAQNPDTGYLSWGKGTDETCPLP